MAGGVHAAADGALQADQDDLDAYELQPPIRWVGADGNVYWAEPLPRGYRIVKAALPGC